MSRFYEALKEASRRSPAMEERSWRPGWEPGDTAAASSAGSDARGGSGTAGGSIATPELPAVEELLTEPAGRPKNGLGVPTQLSLDKKAPLIPEAADPVIVEHYRRLRTKILQQQQNKPFRTLVVTSPGPQEGKTVTVLNLGLSFAMLPDCKVLVVDGDLRRGSLGKWAGTGDRAGLSNLMDGSAALQDVVLKCDELPVYFMTRGTSRVSPAELLQSPQSKSQFRRMGEQFHLVLVDSPPVNLITDTQLLAANCDAVLLIARAFSTNRKSLEKAVQDLQAYRVIGTVLNGGLRAQTYRRYHGYYGRTK